MAIEDVKQALEKLENNDKDYQYLSSCKMHNYDDSISDWLPLSEDRWDIILTKAGLCGSAEMIKNAMKASHFVVALLDIFVAKAKTSRHVFTVGGNEFTIQYFFKGASNNPFTKQGGFNIIVDRWHHIIFHIRLAELPITNFRDPQIIITVKTDVHGKWNTTEIGPVYAIDILKFDNFQKMLDTVKL